MNEFEEKLKDTYGYKVLELHLATVQLKHDIAKSLPLPKRFKELLLRQIMRELFTVDKAMKEYLYL
ncbi:MAG TPA: hypothetical protein PKA19_06295 [Bacillota bacterium]|nr:hypothetical protein [Bacillota bacterium]